MKANVFMTVIAVLLGALLGYWAYDVAEGEPNDVMCGIATAVCLAATLIPTMGLRYGSRRMGVNIRLVSAMFFVLFLVSHFLFAAFGVRMPYYLLVNGLLLLVYLAVFYKMQGIKDV